jgi:hypothetical protein
MQQEQRARNVGGATQEPQCERSEVIVQEEWHENYSMKGTTRDV